MADTFKADYFNMPVHVSVFLAFNQSQTPQTLTVHVQIISLTFEIFFFLLDGADRAGWEGVLEVGQ